MRTSKLLVFAAALAAIPASAQDLPQDPPSRVARLNYMSGSVSFRPGTVEDWTSATINYPLYNGDHLWADRDARTELHIGSTALRMGPETALAILNLTDDAVQLSLTGGSLHIRLRDLGEGESFEVDTPNAAITLLRSGEYRINVDGERNVTTVAVRAGDAEATGGGRAFTLHPRDGALLAGADDTFSGQLYAAAPPDDFELWCQQRDRREEQAQSVSHVSRETIGYEDLDDNGVWSEVPDYGWVWAPRVNPGWAPYRDGHWAWVEPWGWTWVDDAPWGFAPFHYGRWASYRGAWVWVPGAIARRPVYAPALVAFVGMPGRGVSVSIGAGVAWFPLGPHEVYRPAYRVSEFYVRQVNVTHVTNINVTNVRYVNQNATAVTVVSREAFVGARPVRMGRISAPPEIIAQGRVIGATANIAPERVSVIGGGRAGVGAPPVRFAARAVVVRNAPPPPPVSFAARSEALRANPGRPLEPAAAEALRRNDRRPVPVFRQAPPAARPMQDNRPAVNRPPDPVREQAPRVQREGPPTPLRLGQPTNLPAEAPRRAEEPAPRVQREGPPTPLRLGQPTNLPAEAPRRTEEPAPRVQREGPPTPLRLDRPTNQPAEAPRRTEEPRPAPQPAVQPRTEPRSEPAQQPRTERKEEKKRSDAKKKEEHKEERKQ